MERVQSQGLRQHVPWQSRVANTPSRWHKGLGVYLPHWRLLGCDSWTSHFFSFMDALMLLVPLLMPPTAAVCQTNPDETCHLLHVLLVALGTTPKCWISHYEGAPFEVVPYSTHMGSLRMVGTSDWVHGFLGFSL